MAEPKSALKELLKAASPGPWFLDGFNLHDAGTWMIAVMAREGNPSYKSDPEATKRLAALAPGMAQELIDRRSADLALAEALVLLRAQLWRSTKHVPEDFDIEPTNEAISAARDAEDTWNALGKAEEERDEG